MNLNIKLIALSIVVGIISILPARSQQQLSLQDAVDLALHRNPEIAATNLEVEKAQQQKVISRSLFLPSISLAAQANHYFKVTPFFGFGESSPGDKIPYGRLGGEDQFVSLISAVQPLFNPQAFPTMQYSRLQEEEKRLELNATKIGTQASVKQT